MSKVDDKPETIQVYHPEAPTMDFDHGMKSTDDLRKAGVEGVSQTIAEQVE